MTGILITTPTKRRITRTRNGSGRVYPWSRMEIGDWFLYCKRHTGQRGRKYQQKANGAITAIREVPRYSKMKFKTRQTHLGVKIIRIA